MSRDWGLTSPIDVRLKCPQIYSAVKTNLSLIQALRVWPLTGCQAGLTCLSPPQTSRLIEFSIPVLTHCHTGRHTTSLLWFLHMMSKQCVSSVRPHGDRKWEVIHVCNSHWKSLEGRRKTSYLYFWFCFSPFVEGFLSELSDYPLCYYLLWCEWPSSARRMRSSEMIFSTNTQNFHWCHPGLRKQSHWWLLRLLVLKNSRRTHELSALNDSSNIWNWSSSAASWMTLKNFSRPEVQDVKSQPL